MFDKKFKKVAVTLISAMTLFAFVTPAGAAVVQSAEIEKQVSQAQNFEAQEIQGFVEQMQTMGIVQQANGELALTPEMEAKVRVSVENYIKEVTFGRNARFMGQNFFNSNAFVAGLIDAALTPLGINAMAGMGLSMMRLILRVSKAVILPVVRIVLETIGLSIANDLLQRAFDLALVLTGPNTIGGLIALGLDHVDGNVDGFIFA